MFVMHNFAISLSFNDQRKDPCEPCPEDFGLPFPELCHLNLANNKVCYKHLVCYKHGRKKLLTSELFATFS